MKKQEIASIIFFFLIVISVSFFIIKGPGITGAAVSEEKPSEDSDDVIYGTYSITPNFKTKIDYDFSEYEDVVNKAKEMYEECSLEQDLEDCINLKIIEYSKEGLQWKLSCDTDEEDFFSSFVEGFISCKDSYDKEGFCEFKVLSLPNEKFTVHLSSEDDKTKIELKDKGLIEYIDIPCKYPADIDFDFTVGDFISETAMIIDNEDTVKFYKKEDELYYFKEKKDLKFSFSSDLKISPAKKDTYRFCVISPYTYYKYDEEEKKVEEKNLEYRFALRFKDELSPPKISGVEVKDKTNDENSITVSWDESSAKDVKSYIVYYSEEDFSGQDIINKDIKNPEDQSINIAKKEFLVKDRVEIDEIGLENCFFLQTGKPCTYENYDEPLENDKLYYLNNKQEYLIVIDNILDDESYNVFVIAEDHLGNLPKTVELEEDKFLADGMSIDDLEPGLISTLEKSGLDSGILELSWDSEIYNIDGTISKDISGFNVYYREQDEFLTLAESVGGKRINKNKLSKKNVATLKFDELKCEDFSKQKCYYSFKGLTPLQAYLIGVTAVDTSGNEYDMVLTKSFAIS